MFINAGNFNKKIEIVEYQLTKDADGFPKKQEKIILKTWAKVSNISGTETLRSGSDFSEIKTRFLMRTPKQKLDKDMVIKFKGQVYEIVYIKDYNYDRKCIEILTNLVIK